VRVFVCVIGRFARVGRRRVVGMSRDQRAVGWPTKAHVRDRRRRRHLRHRRLQLQRHHRHPPPGRVGERRRRCATGLGRGVWSGVLGGYSGGAREYYWGTTGVLQGYYYSRCSPEEPSSIPLTANWKGSTSYCGQRHGIAIRLLGVALLSTAPVSTLIQMLPIPFTFSCAESGFGDSMSGDDVQHEQDYARTRPRPNG
jgi:hypothetical protein